MIAHDQCEYHFGVRLPATALLLRDFAGRPGTEATL
jgi:hypothetical protein